MPAETVLEMATINGAKVLGLADQIGSLEAGKKADMIVLNPMFPTPVTLDNVIAQLVAFGKGSLVQDAIVDGSFILRDRKVVTTDEEVARLRCIKAAESLWDQPPQGKAEIS
jgi:5-methylthioadenosine/S-adenosylhomocysteine deaminase